MNKTEKLLYNLLELNKTNKLENYYRNTPIEEVERSQILVQEVLSLQPQSTETLKELCKNSKDKYIIELLNKKYLTQSERVHLAIHVVAYLKFKKRLL